MKVLVLNSGSSSIKYQLFDMGDRSALATGVVAQIGERRIAPNCVGFCDHEPPADRPGRRWW